MEAPEKLTKELLEEVLNSLIKKNYCFSTSDEIAKDFRDSLNGREFEIKSPSKNVPDIKAVNFRKKDPRAAVQSLFKDPETKKETGSSQKAEGGKGDATEGAKDIDEKVKRPETETKINTRSTADVTKPKTDGTGDGTKEGKDIHKLLAEKINSGSRDGVEGKLLKDLEETCGLKFIKAEVPIYAVAESTGKLQFWRGKIDAVGLTDDGQVVIFDWKTTNDVLHFWTHATVYGDPVHQCLLYARFLKTHLSARLPAEVVDYGPIIMIVAINRNDLNLRAPRLCAVLGELKKEGFMEKLDIYHWSIKPDQVEAKVETTEKMLQIDPNDPLFSEQMRKSDEATDTLKDVTLLSDIFHEKATVGDLRWVFKLPPLQITPKAPEETVKSPQDHDSLAGSTSVEETDDSKPLAASLQSPQDHDELPSSSDEVTDDFSLPSGASPELSGSNKKKVHLKRRQVQSQ